MSIQERMVDADLLWAAGRREGALLTILIAVTAAARHDHPDRRDGDAFRTFLSERHSWSISVEHRGRQVDIDQLMWKWLRCELAHRAALPIDVEFGDFDGEPDELHVQAGGPPGYRVRLSDGWYHWLRRLLDERVKTGDDAKRRNGRPPRRAGPQ